MKIQFKITLDAIARRGAIMAGNQNRDYNRIAGIILDEFTRRKNRKNIFRKTRIGSRVYYG